MDIYFLRHGIAVELQGSNLIRDADRPLTPEGKRKVRKVAEAMGVLEVSFDLVLASPYLRARQTAEIIVEAFSASKRLTLSEALTPGGSSQELIRYLARLDPPPSAVLLVGHEPYLSSLISLLISGSPRARIELKKAALCKVSAQALRHGACATLEWLLSPRQMSLIAAKS